MNFIYLVTTFDVASLQTLDILIAFKSKDKAEDFWYMKKEQQTDYSYEYLIETIAIVE